MLSTRMKETLDRFVICQLLDIFLRKFLIAVLATDYESWKFWPYYLFQSTHLI